MKKKGNKGRRIMSITIIVILSVILVFILIDGIILPSNYNPSNDPYNDYKNDMTPIQYELISSGILAASSHNMQPWKIKIVDDHQFNLYIDMSKTLDVVDQSNLQLLISQGTFIGLVKNEALNMGIDLSVEYSTIDLSSNLPLVAQFYIDSEDDAIIVDALTTPSVLRNAVSIPFSSEIYALSSAKYDQYIYQHVTSTDSDYIKLQNYLMEGTIIESKNQDAVMELLEVFRFTKWDKNAYRYGLSLNTMSPLLQTFIEPILKYTSEWKSFGESSIKTFEKRLQYETDYLLIKKNNPSYHDYILLGELMADISQQSSGFIPRPAVQVLQDIDGMQDTSAKFQQDFGDDATVLFILGFTNEPNLNHEIVRHKISDLLLHP